MYWARSIASQTKDKELASEFLSIAESLEANEKIICQEFIDAQGEPVDIDGYYFPSVDLASRSMRPSKTFNSIIEKISDLV